MRQQKSGKILNVSSQGGLMGFTGSSAYCSAKFAVVGLSLTMRTELAPFGIEVSVVCPGSLRTDFRDASSMQFPQVSMAVYQDSEVRSVKDFLVQNNHKQEGDPAKVAAFVCEMTERGNLPQRLLIGAKCCEQVKADILLTKLIIRGVILHDKMDNGFYDDGFPGLCSRGFASGKGSNALSSGQGCFRPFYWYGTQKRFNQC